MKTIKITVLTALSFLISHSTFAQPRIGTFDNVYGWSKGETGTLTLHGIDLTLEVRASSPGKLYYVVAFTNNTDDYFNGGASINQSRPETTFFSMNLSPGETKEWGVHLPEELETLYVLLKKHQ